MENASKVLIMGASILIGVMILSIMVYMFSDASKVNRAYEEKENSKEVSAFNSGFIGYETVDNELIDSSTGNLLNDTDARFTAAQELNKISDVISAVNEAYSINYKNSNQYKSDYIEYTNGMIIVIDLKNANVIKDIVGTADSKTKYVVFPHPDIESGYLYGMNDSDYNDLMDRIKNYDRNIDINGYQKVEISKFLEYFRESRLATSSDNPPDSRKYTLYKYYFSGKININSTTSKIDKVIFTLAEDKKY